MFRRDEHDTPKSADVRKVSKFVGDMK